VAECAQLIVDPDIEKLPEVLDPIVLAKHLRASRLFSENGEAVQEVQVRVLKHWVGKRCTVEIGFRAENGRHPVIGKVYRKKRAKLFQVMQGIQQTGFGPRDEFSIPNPLAYLHSLRLLLQEKVQGRLAGEIFESGDEPSRAAAAEKCAQWLAQFHAKAPKAGDVSYPKDHLDSKTMQKCSREIARLGGRLADKGSRLLLRLENAITELSPVELRAGHGCYRPSHVIFSPGRTVTFDLDTYDVADPARDVARFLAALRNLALNKLGSIRALDGSADIFLKTYLRVGQPDALRNLHFFEAAACLKRARNIFGHRVPHWEVKAEAMLDQGLRVVQMGVGL
jgi:aminoglycoside phosphotransferase (APT) family kinase protein